MWVLGKWKVDGHPEGTGNEGGSSLTMYFKHKAVQ